MRFTEKDGSKPSLAMLIELRDYPRSRSETVARSCILMFLVRAPEAANLERFEQEFAFQSAPLTEAAPLADLPR